ncbi:MAG: His/Gly/Thr/Pro-type tRNA ligase C-terminal domain-containing protein [Patescibacteria group bacterium]
MAKEKKQSAEPKFLEFKNLDKIGEIPFYYGFTPHQSPNINKTDLDHAKALLEGDYIDDDEDGKNRLPLHVEEKVALLRMYSEENLFSLPQPVMLYFKEPFKGSIKRGTGFHRYCDLEIIGGSKSMAEALLIQTAKTILKEEGFENIGVEINSIGDKDSINRFTRDLNNYYRKHVNDMHAECRQLLKKDPFELLSCQNDKCKKMNEGAPRSMDFLSESSRIHFQEVLEYLESIGVPYKINNHLIGNKKYCTETIFSINNLDYDKKSKDQKVLAIGVRYDGLAKKIGLKKDIQGIGISLLIKGNKPELRKDLKKVRRPAASFVQLGFESKLLSLPIIESLRQQKIALCLSLTRDRLGAQVSVVEKAHIPYSIIMGKKEAVEGTAIVRNTDTHAQDIVSIKELPSYMKKLEK